MSQHETIERRELRLSELQHLEIDHVDVEGGSKFAKRIRLNFKGGKSLWLEAEVDCGSYGVLPRIKYGIGGWGRQERPWAEEKRDA